MEGASGGRPVDHIGARYPQSVPVQPDTLVAVLSGLSGIARDEPLPDRAQFVGFSRDGNRCVDYRIPEGWVGATALTGHWRSDEQGGWVLAELLVVGPPQCRTYWSSHGCSLPVGHPGPHQCLGAFVDDEWTVWSDTELCCEPTETDYLFGDDTPNGWGTPAQGDGPG